MTKLREIRVQTDPTAATRTETYMGREYLVAPIVMLVEGVVQGANAEVPEYVSGDSLAAFSHSWNGRPVVLNHPQVAGTYVSANDPMVLENWSFGFIFNARYEDPKLKAEAWIDTARALELGGDFQSAVDRINAGNMVEISTGLFVNTLEKKGKFNNKSYAAIWDGPLISDHLAILSEGLIGACSVDGGCGIPRINEQGQIQIQTQAQAQKGPWGDRPADMRINTAALRTFAPNDENHDGYCCETCKGAAVPKEPKTQTESESNPVQVEYIEPTPEEFQVLGARAALMVNSIPDTITLEDVRKLLSAALSKKLNKGYIYIGACTQDQVVFESYSCGYGCGHGCSCGVSSYTGYWSLNYSIGEDGAVTFEGEPQEVVLTTKITPVVNEAGGAQLDASGSLAVNNGEDPMSADKGQDKPVGTSVPVTDPAVAPAEAIVANAAPAIAAAQAPVEAPKVQSVNDYLNAMPEDVANVIRAQMSANAARKNELITSIKANSANTFSDEQLSAFDNTQLEAISKLSTQAQPAVSDDTVDPYGRYNYGGRGGIVPSPMSDEDTARINADSNTNGAPKAPQVFASADNFGVRVGSFR